MCGISTSWLLQRHLFYNNGTNRRTKKLTTRDHHTQKVRVSTEAQPKKFRKLIKKLWRSICPRMEMYHLVPNLCLKEIFLHTKILTFCEYIHVFRKCLRNFTALMRRFLFELSINSFLFADMLWKNWFFPWFRFRRIQRLI